MKAGDAVNLSISKDRVYHGMHHDLLMALYYKELEDENKDPSTFYYRLREMERHQFNEWVNTARTKEERAQRINRVIQALRYKQTFKEMKKR